mmetsp:Transcript_52414/g.151029  ORF Transcript_52414/g.151029 Transcript_52414/m.151029 type:complete len:278 (+) Transcript_52414:491-1324(+)
MRICLGGSLASSAAVVVPLAVGPSAEGRPQSQARPSGLAHRSVLRHAARSEQHGVALVVRRFPADAEGGERGLRLHLLLPPRPGRGDSSPGSLDRLHHGSDRPDNARRGELIVARVRPADFQHDSRELQKRLHQVELVKRQEDRCLDAEHAGGAHGLRDLVSALGAGAPLASVPGCLITSPLERLSALVPASACEWCSGIPDERLAVHVRAANVAHHYVAEQHRGQGHAGRHLWRGRPRRGHRPDAGRRVLGAIVGRCGLGVAAHRLAGPVAGCGGG